MISVEEAAEVLKLRPNTVRDYARRNKVPAFKVGRDWFFESVEALVASLQAVGGNKLQQARLRGKI